MPGHPLECGNCLSACADIPGKKLDDGDYCFECFCGAKEGDCDSDGECSGDLVCASNYGARFNLHSGTDVCVASHCFNDTLDINLLDPSKSETAIDCGGDDCGNCNEPCQGPPGSNTFCAYCRCTTGQGDCDYNRDCMPGEVCAANHGPMFGLPQVTDVCVPAHCNDDIQQPSLGETGIDCGGECGNCLPTCETGTPGGNDYCVGCRCNSGKGDCDFNRECAPGLTCTGVGSNYGQTGANVCVPSPLSGSLVSCDTAACCPPGTTVVSLTAGNDSVPSNTQVNVCIVAGDGNDTVTSTGVNSVLLGGLGADTLNGGGAAYLVGGPGNDILTITSTSGGTVIGGIGDDFIRTKGKSFVYPGPGVDNVATTSNSGPLTVAIYHPCEVQNGEQLAGSATSTLDKLIIPVPLAELQGLGLSVSNFDGAPEIKLNTCLSECGPKPNCGEHGYCVEGTTPDNPTCQCYPPYEWNATTGSCDCIPDCANKRCGDDPSDKCGGTCSFCTHSGGPVNDYVAWWKFDEGSGDTTADDTGHGNTGVLGGGTASRRPLWVAGKNGQGLQFDGVDDIVDAGNAEMLSILGPLTVEAWVKPQTAPTDTNLTIVSKGGPVYYPYELRLTMGAAVPVVGWGLDFDPSPKLWGESDTTVTLEQWSHVAMVYDRATVRLYVNGSQDPVVFHYTDPVRNEVAKLFHIGGRAHPNASGIQSFKGTLDDVRVYNRALTAAEIQNNYAYGSGMGTCAGNCSTKQCGDDPDNGCGNGGACTGFCPVGGIGCHSNSDCPVNTTCATSGSISKCTPTTCSNGRRDPDETNVDCGGSCLDCAGPSGAIGSICTQNTDCASGLTCVPGAGPRFGGLRGSNACLDPACLLNPVTLGCGAPTALCGNCSNGVSCQSNADCAGAEVCGMGLGSRYSLPFPNVCVPPVCVSTPETACGDRTSLCGECACATTCSTKQCGDSSSNGCGGTCLGFCHDREAGCHADGDCPSGDACIIGGGPRIGLAAGTNVCLPATCASPNPAQQDCGTSASPCGYCPEPPVDVCANRCGEDPSYGVTCNPCGDGQACRNRPAMDGLSEGCGTDTLVGDGTIKEGSWFLGGLGSGSQIRIGVASGGREKA